MNRKRKFITNTLWKEICDFFHTHTIIIILVIISLFCVFYFEDCSVEIIKNISYCIIAAFIFYLIIDYIPYVKKKKLMRIRIQSNLSNLKEHIRLCKESITMFSFENKTYKNSEDYADYFYNTDLKELGFIKASQTIESYLESHKEHIINISSSLLDLHSYLSNKELNNLISIINSDFITQPLFPQNHGLTNEDKESYTNNQREIGRSIYEIYKLIKEIK